MKLNTSTSTRVFAKIAMTAIAILAKTRVVPTFIAKILNTKLAALLHTKAIFELF